MRTINTIVHLLLMICIVAAIIALVNAHTKFKADYDKHWHFTPQAIAAANLRIKLFPDGVPYHLTTRPKPKRQNPEQYCFTIHYGWR
jgi:hypothetical protein